MRVRVELKVLAPSVEHGQQADLGARVLGIGGQLLQGSRGSSQEQVVHNPRLSKAIGPRALGSVKTTWKYGTGSSSAARASSQRAAAVPRHVGQWRLPQEL